MTDGPIHGGVVHKPAGDAVGGDAKPTHDGPISGGVVHKSVEVKEPEKPKAEEKE